MLDPADLLCLLAVGRSRTYNAAAAVLGVNHTTVARRLKALEREVGERLFVASPTGWELTTTGREVLTAAEAVEEALRLVPGHSGPTAETGPHGLVRVSSTEVFGLLVVVPALSTVRLAHPRIAFELASTTRPTHAYGPASDLDIGVTRPVSRRLAVQKLVDYELGLFASADYVQTHPAPRALADLADHSPIYYVESILQVADLDLVDRLFSQDVQVLGATSVLAQMELTRRGLGIGLLPVYLAGRDPDLVRLLPHEATAVLTYWMGSRIENFRRPEVRVIAEAIQRQTQAVFGSLTLT